jgi:hypothetical protein
LRTFDKDKEQVYFWSSASFVSAAQSRNGKKDHQHQFKIGNETGCCARYRGKVTTRRSRLLTPTPKNLGERSQGYGFVQSYHEIITQEFGG